MRTIRRGLTSYVEAFRQQKQLVNEVAAGAPDAVILCEHPLTITLGRTYKEENILLSRDELAARGVVVVEADRGGDVTLHAPGQLVLYPIIDLKRAGLGLREYLGKLEQLAVDFLADLGIVAEGADEDRSLRGVWVKGKKIASIGIGVSRWVSYHGMGINLNTDLALFKMIRPCGLSVSMTSVAAENGTATGSADPVSLVELKIKQVFEGQ